MFAGFLAKPLAWPSATHLASFWKEISRKYTLSGLHKQQQIVKVNFDFNWLQSSPRRYLIRKNFWVNFQKFCTKLVVKNVWKFYLIKSLLKQSFLNFISSNLYKSVQTELYPKNCWLRVQRWSRIHLRFRNSCRSRLPNCN